MKQYMSIFYKVLFVLAIIGFSTSIAIASAQTSENPPYHFFRTLTIGSTGDDVLQLQRWLNTNGYVVASTGAGSPGKETDTYGARTAAAVKRFQQTHLSQGVATGRFATITREYLNNKLATTGTTGVVLGASISNDAIRADTVKPTVSVSSPVANTTISGITALSATASDNLALAGVAFFLNGKALGSEVTTAPYWVSWDTRTVAKGTYTITAVARDLAGNTETSSKQKVTITN